jgi:hypothetical protein
VVKKMPLLAMIDMKILERREEMACEKEASRNLFEDRRTEARRRMCFARSCLSETRRSMLGAMELQEVVLMGWLTEKQEGMSQTATSSEHTVPDPPAAG